MKSQKAHFLGDWLQRVSRSKTGHRFLCGLLLHKCTNHLLDVQCRNIVLFGEAELAVRLQVLIIAGEHAVRLVFGSKHHGCICVSGALTLCAFETSLVEEYVAQLNRVHGVSSHVTDRAPPLFFGAFLSFFPFSFLLLSPQEILRSDNPSIFVTNVVVRDEYVLITKIAIQLGLMFVQRGRSEALTTGNTFDAFLVERLSAEV